MVIKTAYFQPSQLSDTARAMMHRAARIHPLHHRQLEPEHSALLILDMQEYFLEPASHAFLPSAPAIVQPLVQLAKTFALAGRPVYLTQHVNTLEDAAGMKTWWRDLMTESHPYIQLIPPLIPLATKIIRKTQYDAFYRTPLEETLQTEGVKQLVIGGVVTHLCCETTARAAFQRGFDTFFLADGTATFNAFYHQATLLNLSHGFAVLALCEEIQSHFPSSAVGGEP